MSNINNRRVAPNNVNDDLFNEKIPFKEVMVINSDGTQMGVMSKRAAIELAYSQNLDLLCVAANGIFCGKKGWICCQDFSKNPGKRESFRKR